MNKAKPNNINNIYHLPPDELLNIINIKQIIDHELRNYKEVLDILRFSSPKIEEVAGYLISIVDRAKNIFRLIEKILPKDTQPLSLNKSLEIINLQLDKLNDEKKPNLRFDLFSILANVLNSLDIIDYIFYRVNNVPNFDGNLCEQFIKPLKKILEHMKSWCGSYEAAQVSDKVYFQYMYK